MFEREIREINRIAVEAGDILLEYYSNNPTVEWKSPGNPVTKADRNANDFIVGRLQRLFPEDAVLSEEDPDTSQRLQSSRVWIVDPMDGTNEFISGRNEFAVMIGLAVDGIPVAGVVYQPSALKLYYASRNGGAFLAVNGETRPLHVSTEQRAARMTIAVSRSHHSSRVDTIRQKLRIPLTIKSGSVGLKVGLICEGRADLYIHTGSRTHLWDTCAPEAILREAGGRMTDTFNHPLLYSEPELRNLYGVVASNGVIHERAVSAARAVLG